MSGRNGDQPVAIVHTVCEGIAFWATERPVRGTPMMPDIVRLLDGTTPTLDTPIICGSCGLHALAADLVPEGGW